MQRLIISLKTENAKIYKNLLHKLEPLGSSCLSWRKVNVKLLYSAFLKLGKAVGVSIKNHRNGKNMSIKPQTCKDGVLVCKQTQQAFLEYESITVYLN